MQLAAITGVVDNGGARCLRLAWVEARLPPDERPCPTALYLPLSTSQEALVLDLLRFRPEAGLKELPTGKVAPQGRRTRSEVRDARRNHGGCCYPNTTGRPCDCLERAAPDAPEMVTAARPALAVGDVVRLRSGGPAMTVTEADVDGYNVEASWFDNEGALCSGDFPPAALAPEE